MNLNFANFLSQQWQIEENAKTSKIKILPLFPNYSFYRNATRKCQNLEESFKCRHNLRIYCHLLKFKIIEKMRFFNENIFFHAYICWNEDPDFFSSPCAFLDNLKTSNFLRSEFVAYLNKLGK